MFHTQSKSSLTWVYKKGAITEQQLRIIDKNFSWILAPIFIVLFAKVYFGLRAIYKRFKKPAFMTYYVVSWTFYGSGITQFTIILAVSWHILKEWVTIVAILILLAFIPAWLFMNIHMKLINA